MSDEAPVIGASATDETPDRERLASAIEASGARPRIADLDDLLGAGEGQGSEGHGNDLDAIVVEGTSELRTIARRNPSVPVLPVATESGVPSVPLDDLESAIGAVVSGGAWIQETPLLEVSVDGEEFTTAFGEVTLITAEPARISEFAIEHGRVGPIDTVRADGVVVATPAGSYTYAAAGDGPLLEPDTGLAIVPVAPFRTDRDRWVVPLDEVTVCVQRDEAAVTVEADGAVLATVGRDAEVSLAPAGKLGVLVVDESVRDPR